MGFQMRFVALDSIRGVCAILVCVFHLPLVFYLRDSAFIEHSFLFVDFFFVLSGFVICHAYGDRLQAAQVPYFLLRRFGRLWPLHAFVLAVLLALQLAFLVLHHYGMSFGREPFEGRWDITALGLDILFLNSFGLWHDVTWNGPAWSISAEFWVYLIFATVMMVAAARMVMTAIILSITALVAILALSPDYMNATHDLGLVRCIAGFFAGVCTYRIWQRFLAGRALWAGVEWFATALAVAFVIFCGKSVWSLAAPMVFSLVVLAFAAERGSLSRMLSVTPFRAAGRWSYSIYMVHSTIIFVLLSVARLVDAGGFAPIMSSFAGDVAIDLTPLGGAIANDAAMIAYVGVVLAVAAFTYRFVETPGRTFVNGIANRWEQGRRDRQDLKSQRNGTPGISGPAQPLPPATPAGQ